MNEFPSRIIDAKSVNEGFSGGKGSMFSNIGSGGSKLSPYASLAPAANDIAGSAYGALTGYEADKAWEDSDSFLGLGQGISYAMKDASDYYGDLDKGFDNSKGQQDSFDYAENPFDDSFGGNAGRVFDSATDGFTSAFQTTGDPVSSLLIGGGNAVVTGVASLFGGDDQEKFKKEQEKRQKQWIGGRNEFIDNQLAEELEASRSGAMQRRIGNYEAIPYNTSSIYNV